MATNASPVSSSERLVLIDSLRGLAILGILMVNMQIFYQPVSLMITGYSGSESLIDQVSVVFIKIFSEGKFYVLFSVIYG